MNINIYTWIILILYVALLFFFALRGRARTTTIEQYSVYRGMAGPIVLGVSYAATTISSVVFIGFPGWLYSAGYSGLWASFGVWGFFVLSAIILAKGVRRIGVRYGSLSIPDLLGHHYNSDASRVVFSLVFLINIMYIAATFVGIAVLLNVVLGVSYTASLLVTVAVAVCYILIGGTYAQVFSDFWMGLIMAFTALAIFSIGFWAIDGGWAGMTQTLAGSDPNLIAPVNPDFALFATPLAILSIGFVSLFFGVQSQLAKFYLALTRERDIRVFLVTTTVVYSLIYLAILGGLYARVLYPDIQPDQAVPTLINELFHPAITAIMVLGLISASISTFNTLFVQMGTVLGNDIYRRLMVPRGWLVPTNLQDVDKVTLRVTKGASVVIGIIALLIALDRPAYLGTLGAVGAFGVMAGTAAPLILALYWSRATAAGAIATGVVVPVLFLWLTISQTFASVWLAAAVCILVGFVLMIIVSLLVGVPQRSETHVEETES